MDKNEPKSPLWHKKILEARVKRFEAGKEKSLTLPELKELLRKKKPGT